MTPLITRTLSTGKVLTVTLESGAAVARVDGTKMPPATSARPGEIWGEKDLNTPTWQRLVAAGGTHLLQGNIVLIAGEADLIAAALAQVRQDARDRLAAAVPGLEAWEAASRAHAMAHGAYESASRNGYPAREAAALRRADEALEAVYAAHPATRAWASIMAYCQAHNDRKMAAGYRARDIVQAGGDPIAAAAAMDAEWAAEATDLVARS